MIDYTVYFYSDEARTNLYNALKANPDYYEKDFTGFSWVDKYNPRMGDKAICLSCSDKEPEDDNG